MAENTKEVTVKGNECDCLNIICGKVADGLCANPQCTQCKTCCEVKCKGCETKCQDNKPCKCRMPRCGCKEDCYAGDKDGSCKNKTNGNCKRCEKRCKNSEKCICYFCSCGTKCNGVICSCCSWCDPKNCSGEKCNGYVIGRCRDATPETNNCGGHVKYDNGNPVWKRDSDHDIQCGGKYHPGDCTDSCNRWACGKINDDGFCVMVCTYCGTLCSQDWCRIWLGVLIISLIILSCFIVVWGMFPETFHSVMTKMRATLSISSRRPDRSLSNLVGDTIPEEMNFDRYPAFRPRTYAGLA